MDLHTKSRLERQLCGALRLHLTGGRSAVPESGRTLWRAFMSVSEARSYSRVGPNAVSFCEIDAWCRLMQVPLQPHHVAILRMMDVVWLDVFYAKAANIRGGVKVLPPMSKEPISAALFDVAAS